MTAEPQNGNEAVTIKPKSFARGELPERPEAIDHSDEVVGMNVREV